MLGVLEPLLEQTVFEDVPANLAAIKQRVESMQVGRGACGLGQVGKPLGGQCSGSGGLPAGQAVALACLPLWLNSNQKSALHRPSLLAPTG